MLTLGSGDSTSQGQKKVWPTLILPFLPPPQGDAMPSSQSHKATLMAGPGGPYSFLWLGTVPAWLDGVLILHSGLWTCVYLPDAPPHLHLGAVLACLSCSVCLLQSPLTLSLTRAGPRSSYLTGKDTSKSDDGLIFYYLIQPYDPLYGGCGRE